MARHATVYAADRINAITEKMNSKSYLEIGVREGSTFLHVQTRMRVGIDPKFAFDTTKHVNENCLCLPITSDVFFEEYLPNVNDDVFRREGGKIAFDIIYIDGLHTFEQSLKDFKNSLRFSHDKTVWLLDEYCTFRRLCHT